MPAVVAMTSGSLQAAPTDGPAAGYHELFDAAWSAVDTKFFDPAFNGADWGRVRREYEPRVAGVTSDAQFLKLMTAALDELHVSHLWIAPPERSRTVGLAMHSRLIDGRRIVLDAAPMSTAQALRPGDAILSPEATLWGALGATVTVEVEGCDGSRRRVSVAHEEALWYRQHPSLRWLMLRAAIGPVGYIKAPRFDDDTAPLADRAMAELAGAKAIVIDLRHDGGGNISFVRLASYFIGTRRLLAVLAGRDYLARNHLGAKALQPAQVPVVAGPYTSQSVYDALSSPGAMAVVSDDVGPRRFNGRVVILTDEGTGSASEGFVATMKAFSAVPVTTIGAPTAGYLLGGEIFDLPRGWRISIPTHASWTSEGALFKDTALAPDIRTHWTREDVCNARDPDMAAARSVISANGGDSAPMLRRAQRSPMLR